MRGSHLSPRLAVLALVLGGLAPAARAGVLVVDAAGGGDFTLPSDALAAAVDGDIILIEPGTYFFATPYLDNLGKALTIVGDTGSPPLLPPTVVHDVPAGKTFVLRHLAFVGGAAAGLLGGTVLIDNSAGRVHIEDCTIAGYDGQPGFQGVLATSGVAGLRMFSTNGVAVHRSTITGGKGQSTFTGGPFPQIVNSDGASAIQQEGGQLTLSFVTATGGDGGDGIATGAHGRAAGHGLDATNGQTIVAGCTLIGGDGGTAGTGMTDGASGHGVSATGVGVVFSELATALFGGAGADPLDLPAGQHDEWPGFAVSLILPGPIRSGESGTMWVIGPPDKLFALFFSLGMGYLPKAAFHGTFLPAAPFFGPLLIASTNGGGIFNANFQAPSLIPFGLEGLLNIDQALMVQDNGLVLSSASAYIQVE